MFPDVFSHSEHTKDEEQYISGFFNNIVQFILETNWEIDLFCLLQLLCVVAKHVFDPL